MEWIYVLKKEDNPTEEQINESVKKQVDQLIIIERIHKKKPLTQELFVEYIGKTIEELEQEYLLINNW